MYPGLQEEQNLLFSSYPSAHSFPTRDSFFETTQPFVRGHLTKGSISEEFLQTVSFVTMIVLPLQMPNDGQLEHVVVDGIPTELLTEQRDAMKVGEMTGEESLKNCQF